MKEVFASGAAGLTGLLFFFLFFVAVIIWVFRPGSKKKYENDARIPLEEKENDEQR